MLAENIETSLILSSFNSMICDHIVPFIFSYNIWEPIQKMECMLETWKHPSFISFFLGCNTQLLGIMGIIEFFWRRSLCLVNMGGGGWGLLPYTSLLAWLCNGFRV
jgi:hypothetical protein